MRKEVDILNQYFSPQIRGEATIDARELRDFIHGDPLDLKGYIHVKPPKGTCFVIRRHYDLKDINVCKEQYVPFQLRGLDDGGRIKWTVTTGEGDFGTDIWWQTPYRLASYMPLDANVLGIQTPILSCKAKNNGPIRKIELGLAKGDKWVITFPTKDKLMKQPPPKKNLVVVKMRKKGEKKKLPSGGGGLKLKLGGSGKKKRIFNYKFTMDAHNAYKMSAEHFIVNGAPGAMNGICRYKFTGAPEDLESGVVECFNMDSYDAIRTHLTCSKDLGPRK